MTKPGNRLPAETVSFRLGEGNGSNGHSMTVNIGRDPKTGQIVEVAFCEAGKIGHGLQILFSECGLKLSRILQGRDPETGKPLS